MVKRYFSYGKKETDYLIARDERLGAVISHVGRIEREVDPDLFSSLIRTIVGQQISSKAQKTIWQRMNSDLKVVSAENIILAGEEKIQQFGITFRKAKNIIHLSERVKTGELDLTALAGKEDEEVIMELTSLPGIGLWSAEMILLFGLQRPDILSYGDLAIRKGLCQLYGHDDLDKKLFADYKKRFSPHGSVASLYIWAVAGGALADFDHNIRN